jgi:Abnormal spindle-like microcephaly-assoc'd, ASPM-SPD-2-Hydin
LSVSGSLSFGKVKVNATKKKTLKVKNTGKFPLQVTIGNTLVPPFSVTDSGNFMLAKKKTLTVTVLFKPTVAGATVPQMLSISSNDPHHLSHPVTATGSGK